MATWEVNVSFMVEAEDREDAVEKVVKEIVGRLIYDIFEVHKMSE